MFGRTLKFKIDGVALSTRLMELGACGFPFFLFFNGSLTFLNGYGGLERSSDPIKFEDNMLT